MKSIELKKIKENVTIEGVLTPMEITTVSLLRTVINSPAKQGYSISDLMVRIKLLDLVDKHEKEEAVSISFEDADFENLKLMVAECRWVVISRSILEFCQTIEKT